MEITTHVTEKPNSYEFGKAGNRVKVYFSDVEELKQILKELKDVINDGESKDHNNA